MYYKTKQFYIKFKIALGIIQHFWSIIKQIIDFHNYFYFLFFIWIDIGGTGKAYVSWEILLM